jgi:TolA-binding protein
MRQRMGVRVSAALLCLTVLAHAQKPPPPLPPPSAAGTAFVMLLDTLDERPSTATPRERDYILAKIHDLVRLLRETEQADPSRASVLRQLADAYAELRARAMSDATAAYASEHARATAMPLWEAANEKSSSYFRQLIDEYPDDPKITEARFYLALEVAQLGTHGAVRQALREVFSKDPTSALAPLARFGYAELFRLDGKLALATTEYLAITKYSEPNPVACLALERLKRTALFLKLKLDDPDAFVENLACDRNERAKVH